MEAQVRARQLNSQLSLKKQEEKIKVIEDQRKQFQVRYTSVLPDEFVSEFEARFIRARDILEESKKKTRNKNRFTTWRAAQKIIVKVGLDPSKWFYHQTLFYDVFYESQVSLSYLTSILSMINLWGHFMTRKLCLPFSPIQRPKGMKDKESWRLITKKQPNTENPQNQLHQSN